MVYIAVVQQLDNIKSHHTHVIAYNNLYTLCNIFRSVSLKFQQFLVS